MAKFTKLNLGDVVASGSGRVFKKLSTESAEPTDSIVGTWVFNDTLDMGVYQYIRNTIYFDFVSNGISYTSLEFRNMAGELMKYGSTTVYDEGWTDQSYRTITINSIPDNVDFAEWLKANATKQSTEPKEQLPAPYGVAIDGNTLTFGDYSCYATEFDILVDGVVKATTTNTSFDLSSLNLGVGMFRITVIAKAEGYANSEPSEEVLYNRYSGGAN